MHKINPKDFFDKYLLIGSIDSYQSIEPRKCRFCGETSDLFFKTDTHLISELLGENNFFSNDECDKCNSLFSKYESQLAILARPFLTLTNTKTKSKTPTFQSRTDFENQTRTTIQVDKSTSQRIMTANPQDVVINENGTFEIILRNPEFRPTQVYKALCKMALGIMPLNEIGDNKDYFDWLIGEKELFEISHGFLTKLFTIYSKSPSVMLYQSKKLIDENYEYPEFIGIVYFANVVIQFCLPISNRLLKLHKEEYKLNLTIFPAFAHDGITQQNQKTTITHINLTQKEKIKYDEKFIFKPRK